MGFAVRRSVVPTAKQDIPWDVEISAIAFDLAVVELVVKISEVQALFVAKQHVLESHVGYDDRHPAEHQMEDDVHWV